MKNRELGSVADTLWNTLRSPNEVDSNLEAANVVDGLFAVARAISRLADVVEEKGRTSGPG